MDYNDRTLYDILLENGFTKVGVNSEYPDIVIIFTPACFSFEIIGLVRVIYSLIRFFVISGESSIRTFIFPDPKSSLCR